MHTFGCGAVVWEGGEGREWFWGCWREGGFLNDDKCGMVGQGVGGIEW